MKREPGDWVVFTHERLDPLLEEHRRQTHRDAQQVIGIAVVLVMILIWQLIAAII